MEAVGGGVSFLKNCLLEFFLSFLRVNSYIVYLEGAVHSKVASQELKLTLKNHEKIGKIWTCVRTEMVEIRFGLVP